MAPKRKRNEEPSEADLRIALDTYKTPLLWAVHDSFEWSSTARTHSSSTHKLSDR
jgi:hypothetical protein